MYREGALHPFYSEELFTDITLYFCHTDLDNFNFSII